MSERISQRTEISSRKKVTTGLAVIGLAGTGVFGVSKWNDGRDYEAASTSWNVLRGLADTADAQSNRGLYGQDDPFVAAHEAGVLDRLPYGPLSPRVSLDEVNETMKEMANGDRTAQLGITCLNALIFDTGVTLNFRKGLNKDILVVMGGGLTPSQTEGLLKITTDNCANIVAERTGRNG